MARDDERSHPVAVPQVKIFGVLSALSLGMLISTKSFTVKPYVDVLSRLSGNSEA